MRNRNQKSSTPKVEKISTTVRLPEDVRRNAKAHAAELGITIEEYVAKALRLFHQRAAA